MTLYGPTVPIAGWSKVNQFVAKTRQPTVIRVYPGPRKLQDLSAISKTIANYPYSSIVYHVKVANKGYQTEDFVNFAIYLDKMVAKLPSFYLTMDAEPDRKDRTYSDSSFRASFHWLAWAIQNHAPHVTMFLNLTGYDFEDRIGRYDKIMNRYSVLALDPYWTRAASAVQGVTKGLEAAARWAYAHHKKLAFAEWGAEQGVEQATRLATGLDWIKRHNLLFACYYQEDDPSVPIKTALTTEDCFSIYRGATAV